MSDSTVIFIFCLIVLVGLAGVIAVSFERRRVRENVMPDRVPFRSRFRRSGGSRARRRWDDDPVDGAIAAGDYPHDRAHRVSSPGRVTRPTNPEEEH